MRRGQGERGRESLYLPERKGLREAIGEKHASFCYFFF